MKIRSFVRLFFLSFMLTGCHLRAPHPHPHICDPMEITNRSMVTVNKVLDRTLFMPFTLLFKRLPLWGKHRVINLLQWVESPISIINSALQGKTQMTFEHLARFMVNGTWGVLGLFDVATLHNLRPEKQDFGKTLQAWGAKPGPYMITPIFGPMTARDSLGRLFDCFLVPPCYFVSGLCAYYALSFGYLKTVYEDVEKDFEKNFPDGYKAMRYSYHQSRGDIKEEGDSKEDEAIEEVMVEEKEPSTQKEEKNQRSPSALEKSKAFTEQEDLPDDIL